MPKPKKIKFEYQMVVVRPTEHTSGQREFRHKKRDVEHLLKGITDHHRDQDRIAELLPGYRKWEVYAEYREVVEWTRWGE